jgi:hypothetical protein
VPRAWFLNWAVAGGGLIAAFGGAVRSAGIGNRRRWLVVGLALGLVVAIAR